MCLSQEIGAFVMIAEEPFTGRIRLAENDGANRAQPGFFPRPHEEVNGTPAIEAHAQAVRAQDAVHLREGWFKPGVVVIVEYGLSGVVLVRPVASDIRRISEDKVDAAIVHGCHPLDAVSSV